MIDQSQEILDQALQRIRSSLERVARKRLDQDSQSAVGFVSVALARIKTSLDARQATQKCDWIIEAVIEDLRVKQDLFAMLDEVASETAIFASNTSSLSVAHIMSVARRHAHLCVGLHFFNPVPVMQLVEVISTNETSLETTQKAMHFIKSLNKTPVTCKDTPGFIVNRLLLPMLMEAIRMVDRGDAIAKDIDAAMTLGTRHPMGPLALADQIGLDVLKGIIDGWRNMEPTNPLFAPSPILTRLVAEGKLGFKTQEGFYKYSK